MNLLFDFFKTLRFPYKSRSDIRQYQLSKFREVVHHACENVPFYRKKYEGMDLGLSSLKDVQKLPVINAPELRKCHLDEITSKKVNKNEMLNMSTTGTSGSPLKFRLSKKENAVRQLSFLRFMLGYGWWPWWKVVQVWREVSPKKYSVFQRLINSRKFHVSIHQPVEDQVKQLWQINPQMLHGTLTSVEQIADWLVDHGESLKGIRVISTGGEVKKSYHGEKFKKAFGTPGIQRYGAVECGIMGYSCIYCGQLYFDEQNFFVEVVDDSYRPVKNGEQGKVLFTTLNQYTTPLVRYELGDMITLSESQGHCKNKFLHFKSIDGREFDVLPLKDGRQLHSQHLIHGALRVSGLKKIQLLLKKDQSLLVKYIADNEICDEIIRKELIKAMRFEALEVDFERCEVIPNEASGKFKFLKRE